jgi:hypothetical protein
LFGLGAVLAAAVLAAVALGQDAGLQVPPMVTVTPNKAGTPSHPRGVRIDARATIDRAGDSALPVVRSFDAWWPKGWVYNGAKHPVCTAAKLTRGGPSACLPESIMGSGQVGHPGDANYIGPSARVTVINGGATRMNLWVVLQNPARVQAAVPTTITKVSSPRWSYRLHADIPGSLQVVAGIPITLDFFRVNLGRGDWIATTDCPHDHRWPYHLRMTSTSGQVFDITGAVACRN